MNDYKVEYLIIVDNKKTTTISSLKNLIQSDDKIVITEEYLEYNEKQFTYKITNGEITNAGKTPYFNLEFSCETESDLIVFDEVLKRIKDRLSLLLNNNRDNKELFILWDDISKYYASKVYDKVHYTENLMRKLLMKFVLINLGSRWQQQVSPIVDVLNTKQRGEDPNFFNNLNFMDLSDFLFKSKEELSKKDIEKKWKSIKKRQWKNQEDFTLLLFESNWTSFFEGKIIEDCSGDYLKGLWKSLSTFRNQIAHHKTFSRKNFEEVEKITNEISGYLEAAISKMEDENPLKEDERILLKKEMENVTETIISRKHKALIPFIKSYEELESNLQELCKSQIKNSKEISSSIEEMVETLLNKKVISDEMAEGITELSKFKKLNIHIGSSNFDEIVVEENTSKIDHYIENIKNLIEVDESTHTDKIKDKDIVSLYEKLKSEITALNGVTVKYNKYYISFIKERNIADVRIQQKSLKIWINLEKGKLTDVKGITKDMSKTGHLGNGDYEIHLDDKKDIDDVMDLIKQSYYYEKN